jgi:hypothetical protein
MVSRRLNGELVLMVKLNLKDFYSMAVMHHLMENNMGQHPVIKHGLKKDVHVDLLVMMLKSFWTNIMSIIH